MLHTQEVWRVVTCWLLLESALCHWQDQKARPDPGRSERFVRFFLFPSFRPTWVYWPSILPLSWCDYNPSCSLDQSFWLFWPRWSLQMKKLKSYFPKKKHIPVNTSNKSHVGCWNGKELAPGATDRFIATKITPEELRCNGRYLWYQLVLLLHISSVDPVFSSWPDSHLSPSHQDLNHKNINN